MGGMQINPNHSALGLRGYNNYFSYGDERGVLSVWFQPSSVLLDQLVDIGNGIQIQQATVRPGMARGHHYHPDKKVVDCFFLETGAMVLGLESLDRSILELYRFLPGTVLLFPPFVAHTAWNMGDDVLRFTTFRTASYAIKPCTVEHQIRVDGTVLQDVSRTVFSLPSVGSFGFDNIDPVMQPQGEQNDSSTDYWPGG